MGLVIDRQLEEGKDTIIIGGNIIIKVTGLTRGRVTLLLDAPLDIPIVRGELVGTEAEAKTKRRPGPRRSGGV